MSCLLEVWNIEDQRSVSKKHVYDKVNYLQKENKKLQNELNKLAGKYAELEMQFLAPPQDNPHPVKETDEKDPSLLIFIRIEALKLAIQEINNMGCNNSVDRERLMFNAANRFYNYITKDEK